MSLDMKVGVIAGGLSNERHISLKSGRAVYKALKEKGYDVRFINIRGDAYGRIKDSNIDVAFIALHGRFGEDGTIQAMLEKMGIPYTGSGVKASRLSIDKIAAKRIFEKNGIRSPHYLTFSKGRYNIGKALKLGWPIVVKPQLEGSSIGLSIVYSAGALKAAIKKAFGYGDKILLEEYIDGRELTVGILDEKPLPVVEIITPENVYDTRAKYRDKRTKYVVPAVLYEDTVSQAHDMALKAHLALGCKGFSRVDMRMGLDGRIYVLELNSIPGMTERSLLPKAALAFGLKFGELCEKLLQLCLN